MSRSHKTELERFTSKYEIDANGCWLWAAGVAKQRGGYGQFHLYQGQKVYAHRWSYEHFVGPIPDGFQIDHLCRVTRCVNPSHLEPVTCRENVLRGENQSAINARKTHCVNGHEFTPENTYSVVTKRGTPGRQCKTCSDKNAREAHRRARSSSQLVSSPSSLT